MFTVIVTGWPSATVEHHRPVVEDVLGEIFIEHDTAVTLRHGKCPYGGVDLVAHELGTEWGWTIEQWPAREHRGRRLESERNRKMCAAGANLMVAFPGPHSTDTWDCLSWAVRYGIPFRGHGLTVPTTVYGSAEGGAAEAPRFTTQPCRSCGAAVIWATTTAGKAMPVDADPGPGGDVALHQMPGRSVRAEIITGAPELHGADLRTSHFVTCPDADAWRKGATTP